jgi:hypothetical protein
MRFTNPSDTRPARFPSLQSAYIVGNVRLWAIELQVPAEPATTGFNYPQVVIEADDLDQARELAKQRIRQENAGRLLQPNEIRVWASAEIGLENIWIFNDCRFHDLE